MQSQGLIPVVLIISLGLALLAAMLFVGTAIYRRYIGLSRTQSLFLCLVALTISGAFLVIWFVILQRHWQLRSENEDGPFGILETLAIPQQICLILLPLLVVPFVARLYRKWIGGFLSERENNPGVEGIRAWLSVGNVLCALVIPLLLRIVFNIPLVPCLTFTFGLLLAYPLLNMISQSLKPVPAAPTEDLSREREKVLELLETGKINADESAELLNALGHSVSRTPTPSSMVQFNPHRKMILLGALLVLLGFFLPWLSINPVAETNRIQSELQQNMNQQIQNVPGAPNIPTLTTYSQTGWTIHICGGDVPHGLGWFILFLGITAAVLPFFALNLNQQIQQNIILGCLFVGAIILAYLLTNNLRFVSIGILLGLAGYALEFVGALRQRQPAR